MTTIFVPAAELHPSAGHGLSYTPEGVAYWVVSGHHGQVLHGPYLPVREGVYRVKVLAEVEGPPDSISDFEVFDIHTGGRTYAARTFHRDPEMFVRLHDSLGVEFRFHTAGETLHVHGVEIEPLLLDAEPTTIAAMEALAARLIAGRAEPAAVFRAADVLADLGAADRAQAVRMQYLTTHASLDVDLEIGKRLLKLHGPVSDMNDRLSTQELSPEGIKRWVDLQRVTEFDVMKATPEAKFQLQMLGYQFRYLEATRLHRDEGELPRMWRDRRRSGEAVSSPPVRQPMFEPFSEIDRSYQASMARGLGFPAYCPASGELLRSRHAFLLQYQWKPFVMHRFEGREVFYVCTGYNGSSRLFIFLPRTKTVIWIADPDFKIYDANEIIQSFASLLIQHCDACATYLKNPTKPVAVVGNDNYGHYFWLTVSGLQFLVENGLENSLSGLVKISAQFARVEEIFPELAGLPIYDTPEREEAFLNCVTQGFLPIHFTDIAISEALAQRLRILAREKASPAGRPPADAPRPLLWLNLRAHNKVWASQVEGYAEILNALAKDYGQASALLDGVPDCLQIATEIAQRCGPNVTLYDGLKFSLWDKMNWAMESDGYICVIGTGLIICHSLAGARGVAHGNREHMTQLRFWHTIQEGSPTPLAPRMEDVHDSGEGLQRDYDVDWRILLQLIRDHLHDTLEIPPAAPSSLLAKVRGLWPGSRN